MNFFADLLNDNAITNVAIVGIGNMGSALLNYRFHERNKMKIVMAFDLDDHELINTKSKDGIPIYGNFYESKRISKKKAFKQQF